MLNFSKVTLSLVAVSLFSFADNEIKYSQELMDGFGKNCEYGNISICTTLGTIYENGLNGVEKDIIKAIKYYKKACGANEYEACSNLGTIYMAKQEYKKAMELYTKACNGGETMGCNNLGAVYSLGEGAKMDKVKGAMYYKKACDTGNWLGCRNFAKYQYDLDNIQKTKEYTKKACDMGRDADDVKNIPESKEIWQEACRVYHILK